MDNTILICVFLFFLCLYVFFSQKEHRVYGTLVDTPEDIRKGLMFRKHKLKPNEGMLFKTGWKHNSFWMKNTYIPLDMIFLSNDGTVLGFIEDAEPLTETPRQISKQSYYVLEMNGNSVSQQNIRIGDRILFYKI